MAQEIAGFLEYMCGSCGIFFKAPHCWAYGDFMMRSKGSGAPAILHTLGNGVYAEVDQLLQSIGAYEDHKSDRVEILQRVFGVACDLAEDGTEFEMNAMPACPVCHSRKMAAWDTSTGAPLPQDRTVPVVMHHRWEQLDQAAKRNLLRKRLHE